MAHSPDDAVQRWADEHAPGCQPVVTHVDGMHVAALRTPDGKPLYGAQRLVIDDNGTVYAYPGNVPPAATVARHRAERG